MGDIAETEVLRKDAPPNPAPKPARQPAAKPRRAQPPEETSPTSKSCISQFLGNDFKLAPQHQPRFGGAIDQVLQVRPPTSFNPGFCGLCLGATLARSSCGGSATFFTSRHDCNLIGPFHLGLKPH